jgi:hypothetical protein
MDVSAIDPSIETAQRFRQIALTFYPNAAEPLRRKTVWKCEPAIALARPGNPLCSLPNVSRHAGRDCLAFEGSGQRHSRDGCNSAQTAFVRRTRLRQLHCFNEFG